MVLTSAISCTWAGSTPSEMRKTSEPKLAPSCRARTSVTTPLVMHRADPGHLPHGDHHVVELQVRAVPQRHVELQRGGVLGSHHLTHEVLGHGASLPPALSFRTIGTLAAMTAPFARSLLGWKASTKNKLRWPLVPNFADVDNPESMRIAAGVLDALGVPPDVASDVPKDPGGPLELAVRDDLACALPALQPESRLDRGLRPDHHQVRPVRSSQ